MDGSTVQYQTNWTTTDSNGGTTKPVTQNVMTTEASTPNPEGETVYHGNSSGWCKLKSMPALICLIKIYIYKIIRIYNMNEIAYINEYLTG